ncbi:hypothetical protein ACUNFC_10780 [Serratia sp. IR-2025]
MSDFQSYSFGQVIQSQVRRENIVSNSGLDSRVARMESDVSYIRRDISDIKGDMKEFRNEMKEFRGEIKEIRNDMRGDFRLLFGAIITVTVGLAGIMAKGFGWL